jgi:hypothetical protein
LSRISAEIIHRVPALGRDQGVGEHGVEERAGDFDAVVEQHGEVVFQVVADLFRGLVKRDLRSGRFGIRIRQGRYQPSWAFQEKAMPNNFASKRSSEVVSMSKQKRLCTGRVRRRAGWSSGVSAR